MIKTASGINPLAVFVYKIFLNLTQRLWLKPESGGFHLTQG
jgi:hypothetical protein